MLGQIAGDRSGHGWFQSGDIGKLFTAFRIPTPSVTGILSNLRKGGLVVGRGSKRSFEWALTPEGRERAENALAELDYAALAAEELASPGAEFLHALHTILDPVFAPARWKAGIDRLDERFSFDRNVFCMTRFPTEDGLPDPVQAIVDRLRAVADEHGLVLHLASDRQLDDDLMGNIGAYMWGCRYGIGLLEDRLGKGLNYNVVTELGAMLITGRRCALLKDRTAPPLPSDLAGQLYKPMDFDDSDAVAAEVHRWMAEDLGLGKCPNC